MKNKKNNGIFLFVIGFIVILLLSIYAYLYFNPVAYSGNLSLSISDKQWIDKNKDQVIDVAISNNIPVYSFEGKGYVFSFMNDFKTDTKMEINGISYNYGEAIPDAAYQFKVLNYKDEVTKNDILFYKDPYVVLGKNGNKLNHITDLNNKKVALIKTDSEEVKNYLVDIHPTYVEYDSFESILLEFTQGTYDYVVIPKYIHLDKIIESDLKVSYVMDSLYKKYVLSLNEKNERLSAIIRNYYDLWIKQYHLTNNYREEVSIYNTFQAVDETQIATFKSKRYIYGYVNNSPYDYNSNGQYIGINRMILNDFSDFTEIEFAYKKYNTVAALKTAVENGSVDIALNYYEFGGDDKYYKTSEVLYSNFVVLGYKTNATQVDTLKSLDGYTTYVMNGSKLESYLKDHSSTTVKTFQTMSDLKRVSKNDFILVDALTYDYHQNTNFEHYVVLYEDQMTTNYGFVISKNTDNALFSKLFDYRLSLMNHTNMIRLGYESLEDKNFVDLSLLWLYIIIVPVLVFLIFLVNGKTKEVTKQKSENKMKYIDPLTSLKNRYYLMSNLNKWNENQVYPQAVIVVDVNNLVNINDKYGHDKGDELIRSAANVLINNQLENSDIMRINGTEFLIYAIGHDEEAIEAYIKKLGKLMKDLPYEYGASMGYSIIDDDIKTVDDALSEATIQMVKDKNRK